MFLLLILQGLQKDDAASKTEGLFDAESTAYIKSVTYCGISIAVLVFIFLIYEIVTRKKRNPNPKRYGKTLLGVYLGVAGYSRRFPEVRIGRWDLSF